jgi:hypothetical protein
MSQTFNLKRFSLLFVKHTADHYKTYLMAFLVLTGMLILTLGAVAYFGREVEYPLNEKKALVYSFYWVVFVLFFIVAGSIFTSIIFSDLGNKKKAISILTLPASHFEKFLIAWIYSYVIFQLLFVLTFYLIVMLIDQLYSFNTGTDITELDLFSAYDGYFTVFAVLHALTLCGSIFFEKLHFIKTAFVLFIGVFTIDYLNLKFIQVFISETVISAMPFEWIKVSDKFDTWIPPSSSEEGFSLVVSPGYDTYTVIVTLIVACILWASSFYRLKEKEV